MQRGRDLQPIRLQTKWLDSHEVSKVCSPLCCNCMQTLWWHKAMRELCYNVRMYVKEERRPVGVLAWYGATERALKGLTHSILLHLVLLETFVYFYAKITDWAAKNLVSNYLTTLLWPCARGCFLPVGSCGDNSGQIQETLAERNQNQTTAGSLSLFVCVRAHACGPMLPDLRAWCCTQLPADEINGLILDIIRPPHCKRPGDLAARTECVNLSISN